MKRWLAFFCCWLPIMVFADTGPEYLEDEEDRDPLSSGFTLLKRPFLEKRENRVHVRSFYQNQDFDESAEREDWAGGGWLSVVGSYWDSRIKFAVTGYTSQKLFADDDKADTGSLQPGHEGYSTLGEVYGSLTLDKVAIQVGRYAVNLPYVNKADIRMIPQTFQGAQAIYTLNTSWSVGGGVLTDIKARTSTGFDSMYAKAGLDKNENVYMAGSLYQPEPGTQLGLYSLHAPDFHNGMFVALSKRITLDTDKYIQFSGQYTRQESIGNELDGDFSVDHYGGRVTWKKDWYSGSMAYTDYPEQDRIRRPWGSSPGYTSIMINDFDRPEESAWLIGGTVDFTSMGAPGISANVKYVIGDTPDCGMSASPDRDEANINLKYAPAASKLAGLVLQLRFGWGWEEETCVGGDDDDVTEVRFVINYAFVI